MAETTTAGLSVMLSLVVIVITVMVMNPLAVMLITVLILVGFSRALSSGPLQDSSATFPRSTVTDASIASSPSLSSPSSVTASKSSSSSPFSSDTTPISSRSSPSSSVTASSSSSSSVIASSSSRSWKYDVFLSFRGEDTRKTFVDHLYSALVERVTCTYKDDVTLSRGDTIGPSLFKAIDDSQIALVVFSENYANSSWCLDELEYIMKCNKEGRKIVMPIFYHVDPSDVRKQKGKYGEAFAKHMENHINGKVELWRKALVAAGNIAGWEINLNVNGYEAKCIKDIVGTILDRLLYSNYAIDENVIGMGTRLQDLKSHLKMESPGARMIGIWGIGGGGKTTLAFSLYTEISSKFDSCCFVENIKEESSMKNLQEKILSTILKIEVKVDGLDKGKQMIKTRLGCKNVLLVLDDIDDRKQLEALAGSHDWFGDGSRIIITTRNEQLLRAHRVDGISHISLLSDEESIRLFYRHAYNVSKPIEDYKTFSQNVVSYCAGLPLALIVLGSFLYDKNKEEWISTLDRIKDIPEMEIVKILKISYDGLKALEKELFLDIACFWRGKRENDEVMEILDACGFHPRIGIKVLIQKGLIIINSYGEFEMHDLIQEMGHYIVRGEHPNNPEKHNRIWRDEEINDMCYGNTTMENSITTEAIVCYNCPYGFGRLVSNAKKLRLIYLCIEDETDIEMPEYLSSELRYMYWKNYPASPFPKSYQPRKLVVLRLEGTLQEELWKGNKYLPCLKELYIYDADNLARTPDFGGLPCLQKLTLIRCSSLEKIHPSLGSHTSLVSVCIKFCEKLKEFPTIVCMAKLEILHIHWCRALSKFPIEANMDNLVNLSLQKVGIEALPSTVGKYCTKLRSLMLQDCYKLKNIEGNFHGLKHLQKCKIIGKVEGFKLSKNLFHEHIHLEELHLEHTRQPCNLYLPRFIRTLNLSRCGLKDGEIPSDIVELSNLQELDLSLNEFTTIYFSLLRLTRLKFLNLNFCRKLVELPELPSSISILKVDYCTSLELVVGDIINTNFKWLCHVSLKNVRSVSSEDILLQTMLQGNAIENGCMRLELTGVEIPKGFRPRLLSGERYRLKLPENWFDHFSGFLFCAVERRHAQDIISMKHEKGGTGSQEEDVYWEEGDYDKETWAGYVSFGSLKHTTWWDPTSAYIEFSLEDSYSESLLCSGVGVCLVSKTGEAVRQLQTTCSSSDDDYKCNFRIKHDSRSHLKGKIRPFIK